MVIWRETYDLAAGNKTGGAEMKEPERRDQKQNNFSTPNSKKEKPRLRSLNLFFSFVIARLRLRVVV